MAHTETSWVRPRTLDLLYRVEAIESIRFYLGSTMFQGFLEAWFFFGVGGKKTCNSPRILPSKVPRFMQIMIE